MGTLVIILVSLAASIVAGLILFFLAPFLDRPKNKFMRWTKKKFTKKNKLKEKKEPLIQEKLSNRKSYHLHSIITEIKGKDLGLLGEIISSLEFINHLPNNPDRVMKEITDKLLEILEKARKIRDAEFNEIKVKLIEYGEKVKKVHVNIGLVELQKLFIRNGQTSDLIDELKEITNSKIKKKKIKAINEPLEKKILEQLNEKYPSTIESDEEILPKYENRDEIRKHLFHLRNKRLIESKIIEEDALDLPVGYMYIRLTQEGIEKLNILNQENSE